MNRTRIFSLLAVFLCLGAAALPAAAAEVDSDSVYCFRTEDFSAQEGLSGICITALPEASHGTITLGARVLRPGDILTAQQVSQMTFTPLRSEEDLSAQVEYLPIYENHVAPCSTMTLAIRGKEDKAPIAEDMAAETYKNLELQGNLKVRDPEGQSLTYTVTRQPRRGSVTIGADGSFTYTPKKNKVGVDSFVFTATDPAGKVSREATVTITILKPTDARQYSDTKGTSCRFTAEWMKNAGIFSGENLAGNPCFNPQQEVTRGEFVTMLVKALEIPAEPDIALTGYSDEIPQWLQPYLAAAVRSGLTANLPDQNVFGADVVITGAEAAVMLQNALDLKVEVLEPASSQEETSPVWARAALQALSTREITLGTGALTRSQAADALYQTVQLKNADSGIFAQ